MNHGNDHGHDHEHADWLELSEEERRVLYAKRTVMLEAILLDVRMHRATECSGAPLCPGGDAAERLNKIPPHQWGDFISTCLAGLADRDEMIENLRSERDQARARQAAAEAEVVASVKEADAGWEAYRLERIKVAQLSADQAEGDDLE